MSRRRPRSSGGSIEEYGPWPNMEPPEDTDDGGAEPGPSSSGQSAPLPRRPEILSTDLVKTRYGEMAISQALDSIVNGISPWKNEGLGQDIRKKEWEWLERQYARGGSLDLRGIATDEVDGRLIGMWLQRRRERELGKAVPNDVTPEDRVRKVAIFFNGNPPEAYFPVIAKWCDKSWTVEKFQEVLEPLAMHPLTGHGKTIAERLENAYEYYAGKMPSSWEMRVLEKYTETTEKAVRTFFKITNEQELKKLSSRLLNAQNQTVGKIRRQKREHDPEPEPAPQPSKTLLDKLNKIFGCVEECHVPKDPNASGDSKEKPLNYRRLPRNLEFGNGMEQVCEHYYYQFKIFEYVPQKEFFDRTGMAKESAERWWADRVEFDREMGVQFPDVHPVPAHLVKLERAWVCYQKALLFEQSLRIVAYWARVPYHQAQELVREWDRRGLGVVETRDGRKSIRAALQENVSKIVLNGEKFRISPISMMELEREFAVNEKPQTAEELVEKFKMEKNITQNVHAWLQWRIQKQQKAPPECTTQEKINQVMCFWKNYPPERYMQIIAEWIRMPLFQLRKELEHRVEHPVKFKALKSSVRGNIPSEKLEIMDAAYPFSANEVLKVAEKAKLSENQVVMWLNYKKLEDKQEGLYNRNDKYVIDKSVPRLLERVYFYHDRIIPSNLEMTAAEKLTEVSAQGITSYFKMRNKLRMNKTPSLLLDAIFSMKDIGDWFKLGFMCPDSSQVRHDLSKKLQADALVDESESSADTEDDNTAVIQSKSDSDASSDDDGSTDESDDSEDLSSSEDDDLDDEALDLAYQDNEANETANCSGTDAPDHPEIVISLQKWFKDHQQEAPSLKVLHALVADFNITKKPIIDVAQTVDQGTQTEKKGQGLLMEERELVKSSAQHKSVHEIERTVGKVAPEARVEKVVAVDVHPTANLPEVETVGSFIRNASNRPEDPVEHDPLSEEREAFNEESSNDQTDEITGDISDDAEEPDALVDEEEMEDSGDRREEECVGAEKAGDVRNDADSQTSSESDAHPLAEPEAQMDTESDCSTLGTESATLQTNQLVEEMLDRSTEDHSPDVVHIEHPYAKKRESPEPEAIFENQDLSSPVNVSETITLAHGEDTDNAEVLDVTNDNGDSALDEPSAKRQKVDEAVEDDQSSSGHRSRSRHRNHVVRRGRRSNSSRNCDSKAGPSNIAKQISARKVLKSCRMTRAMKAQQDIERGILGTRLRKRTAIPSTVKPRKKYTFKNISAPETDKPEEAAEVEQPAVPMNQDMEQGVKSEEPNTSSAARDESAPGTEKLKKGGRKRKWRRTKSAVTEPPIDEEREEGLQEEPAMNDEVPTTSSTSREAVTIDEEKEDMERGVKYEEPNTSSAAQNESAPRTEKPNGSAYGKDTGKAEVTHNNSVSLPLSPERYSLRSEESEVRVESESGNITLRAESATLQASQLSLHVEDEEDIEQLVKEMMDRSTEEHSPAVVHIEHPYAKEQESPEPEAIVEIQALSPSDNVSEAITVAHGGDTVNAEVLDVAGKNGDSEAQMDTESDCSTLETDAVPITESNEANQEYPEKEAIVNDSYSITDEVDHSDEASYRVEGTQSSALVNAGHDESEDPGEQVAVDRKPEEAGDVHNEADSPVSSPKVEDYLLEEPEEADSQDTSAMVEEAFDSEDASDGAEVLHSEGLVDNRDEESEDAEECFQEGEEEDNHVQPEQAEDTHNNSVSLPLSPEVYSLRSKKAEARVESESENITLRAESATLQASQLSLSVEDEEDIKQLVKEMLDRSTEDHSPAVVHIEHPYAKKQESPEPEAIFENQALSSPVNVSETITLAHGEDTDNAEVLDVTIDNRDSALDEPSAKRQKVDEAVEDDQSSSGHRSRSRHRNHVVRRGRRSNSSRNCDSKAGPSNIAKQITARKVLKSCRMTRAMKAQQDIEKGILGTRLRKRTAVPSQVKPRKKYTFKNISAPETEKPEEAAEVEQPPVPMDQDMEQGVKSEGPNTASAARDESAPGTEKPKKGGRKRKWRRTKSAVKEPPIDEKREEGLQDEPAMNDERPTTSSTSREDQGVRKPVQRADEPAEKKKCSRGGRRVKGMRNGVLPPSKLVVDEQEMEQEGEPALDQEPGTSSPAPAPRVQSPVEGEQYVEPEEAPEVEQPAVPIDEEKGEVKQEVESENPSTSSAAQAEQSPHADDQEFLPGTKAKEGQEEETALEVADSSTSSAAPALRAQSPVEMEQVVQPEEAAEVEQPTVPTDKEKDEVEQEVEPENPSTSSVAPVPSVQTSFEEKQDVEPEKAAEVEDPAVPIDEEKEGMEQGVMSEEPSTSSAAQVEHSPHADKLEILPETKANENQEREPAPDDAEPSTSSAAPAPRAKPPVETEQVVQPEEAPEVEQPAVSNDEEQVEREFEFEGMRTPSAAQRELSPQVDALEVSPEAEANEKEGEVPAPDDAEPSTSFASPAPRAKTPGKRGRGKKRGWNLKKENRQTVQPEPSASNVQEKQDVEQQEEPQKVEPPPPNPIVEEQAVGATEQQRTLSVAQRFPPIDRTRGWSFTTVEATREEPLSSAAAVAEKPAPLEDEQSTSSAAPPAVIYKQGWSFTKTNETPLSSPEAIEEPTAASGPEAEAEAEAAEPAEEQEDPRVVAFMNPPSRSSRFDKRISPCQLVLLNRDGYKPAFIEPPNDDLYDF